MRLPIPEGLSFPHDERVIISDGNADYCLGLLSYENTLFFCVLNTGHRAGSVPVYSSNTPIVSTWSQIPPFIIDMASATHKEVLKGGNVWENVRSLGYTVSNNRV